MDTVFYIYKTKNKRYKLSSLAYIFTKSDRKFKNSYTIDQGTIRPTCIVSGEITSQITD